MIFIIIRAHASHLYLGLSLTIFDVMKKECKQSKSHGAVLHYREKLAQKIE
jgi:hypothetical protein